ncbi:hypothetical protein FOMPIDRAFT_1020186 [Fomitopsis schrenkii]|uniref:Uncharacterized protein n=1 Tax=Fomitopsis schrenkii TaxID=2126942 RepID=S8DL23_FOMSC|nr:hypothetical protein FOMPIDRAFT_1020186 [Fomitopsis schrenkii]
MVCSMHESCSGGGGTIVHDGGRSEVVEGYDWQRGTFGHFAVAHLWLANTWLSHGNAYQQWAYQEPVLEEQAGRNVPIRGSTTHPTPCGVVYEILRSGTPWYTPNAGSRVADKFKVVKCSVFPMSAVIAKLESVIGLNPGEYATLFKWGPEDSELEGSTEITYFVNRVCLAQRKNSMTSHWIQYWAESCKD